MKPNERTLIFGGQARLPKEISANEVFQVIAEVDLQTGKVRDVDFTPCPPSIARMLKRLMVEMSMPDDVNDLLIEIEHRLFHKCKKAVITAIKDLVREFREYQYRMTKSSYPSTEG